MSNSKRVNAQLFTLPAILAGIAVVLWPVSYMAAAATVSGGQFVDFWTGALSVSTLIGALVATVGSVLMVFDGIDTLLKD